MPLAANKVVLLAAGCWQACLNRSFRYAIVIATIPRFCSLAATAANKAYIPGIRVRMGRPLVHKQNTRAGGHTHQPKFDSTTSWISKICTQNPLFDSLCLYQSVLV